MNWRWERGSYAFQVRQRTAQRHVAEVLEFAGVVVTNAPCCLKRAYRFHGVDVVAVRQRSITARNLFDKLWMVAISLEIPQRAKVWRKLNLQVFRPFAILV